ncbi:hypothetical protein [Streptomyces mirabilis]|uniref:hypothetical protein n=1 Tax=Streptomyces mirabilis TaxID=68239 RepID=UPI003678D269
MTTAVRSAPMRAVPVAAGSNRRQTEANPFRVVGRQGGTDGGQNATGEYAEQQVRQRIARRGRQRHQGLGHLQVRQCEPGQGQGDRPRALQTVCRLADRPRLRSGHGIRTRCEHPFQTRVVKTAQPYGQC